jgi:hypothetical protein
MLKVLGQLDGGPSQDAETVLCRWVNAVVAKHAQLTPLSVIGQQFFGSPYFRIVLFHFTMGDGLLNVKGAPRGNAASARPIVDVAFDTSCI